MTEVLGQIILDKILDLDKNILEIYQKNRLFVLVMKPEVFKPLAEIIFQIKS